MKKLIKEALEVCERMRKLPETVVEMERAMRGISNTYPELTDYALEGQEWFNKNIGFTSYFTTKDDNDV